MILGDICTRSCRFCAVTSRREGRPVDAGEGERIALAALELGLRYVALTSVDRDDLPDRGASHFAACIAALKARLPGVRTEVLIPDYRAVELAPILAAGPDVAAHNLETVRSLQPVRDARASFDTSLATLRALKVGAGVLRTKSSLMLGLGETQDEVWAAMDELRAVGVDILVLGQYLRPSAAQTPVREYISPEQFDRYAEAARERGFASVVAAPLARTSYHAEAAFEGGAARISLSGTGKPAGCKLIRFEARLEGAIIRELHIRGDFFASPGEAFDRLGSLLAGTPLFDLAASFDRLLEREGIEVAGISGEGLASLVRAAIQSQEPRP
jgi:lipoic acid synthetase